eukprot:TRINITY_DN4613_c0_g1_i1.p1 TRINITY_DN4613_c0_g1~~TRINITY_DN4613_c0_g1_i1.p1  ORF type:complete len:291 (-),score=75.49 TRINITY_DN4613_c0_g1_i1:83-955(-)
MADKVKELEARIQQLEDRLAATLRYKDKVTVVTGGSAGIGEGCVKIFASHGSHVIFCSHDDVEGGKRVEGDANKAGPGSAHFIQADVTKQEDREKLIRTAIDKFGRIDCLINNAGAHPPHKVIDDFPVADFERLLQLNVIAYFSLCQLALPHLRKTEGNIINMSSLVGVMGQMHATTYAATKGAVTSFTKALAVDEAMHKVRVNSVSPGNIWTPMWERGIEEAPSPDAAKEAGMLAQWMHRMGTIEESGHLCLFLAAEATFTTGVDHILSGGAELAYGVKKYPAKVGGWA